MTDKTTQTTAAIIKTALLCIVILTACIVGASFGDSWQFRNSTVPRTLAAATREHVLGEDSNGSSSSAGLTGAVTSHEVTPQVEYLIKLEKEKGE